MALYGDKAYLDHIVAPLMGSNLSVQQEMFKAMMSNLRSSVEWGYDKIAGLFAFVDFHKDQKIFLQHVDQKKFFSNLLVHTSASTALAQRAVKLAHFLEVHHCHSMSTYLNTLIFSGKLVTVQCNCCQSSVQKHAVSQHHPLAGAPSEPYKHASLKINVSDFVFLRVLQVSALVVGS